MPNFLIEEHTSGPYGGNEDIPFRTVVSGFTARFAYIEANARSARTRTILGEPQWFAFDVSELTEIIPDYLWVANDGSSIWYEVRKLP